MNSRPQTRSGATFVELLFAGALAAFLVCALFEGVIVCTRVARRNTDLLEADSRAFDLLWRQFHRDYSTLPSTVGDSVVSTRIDSSASPYWSSVLGAPKTSLDSSRDCYVAHVVPTNSGKQLTIVYTGGRPGNPAVQRKLTLFRSPSSRSPE